MITISAFWYGVLCTIAFEAVALVITAWIVGRKK